jgi:hypothetical protein
MTLAALADASSFDQRCRLLQHSVRSMPIRPR